MNKLLIAITVASISTSTLAQTDLPDEHAPIGVMGDHRHEAGGWMVSYRYMNMRMSDNLRGSDDISADQIVTSVANRFANPPMMPPTVRVVPVDMTTGMHMIGLMHAPTDRLTMMAMLNILDKEMQHLTYQGPAGTTQLGSFTTKTSGLGDTTVGALYGLADTEDYTLHLNLGLSIPTGDIEETDQILTPMNTRPSPRLPYPMQLGSGTYDLEPGITYKGNAGVYGWGTQLKYKFRLDENDEGYSLGNQLFWSGWGSYRFNNKLSASIRFTYTDLDSIDGIDNRIALPVQTADPDNQGGERWDLGLGLNLITVGNHRFALEYETTLEQNVNGVQMKMDDMLTLGYQLAF